jgi:mono/diheme cytochrome c family protein
MKLVKRIVGFAFLALVILLPLAITFTIGWRPFLGPQLRPLSDRRFEATPPRLERGRYLVEAVTGCLDCHSEHDGSQRGNPTKSGREGAGVLFLNDPSLGTLYASNITPDNETGIGNWTDDQIARAIREGIGGDGRALFPIMPYQNFRELSDEDLASVITYIRSIPSIRNAVPKTRINFPLSRLIMTMPQPITEPVHDPELSDPLARGEHLVKLASCAECHTPQDSRGKPMDSLAFAGGFVLDGPDGKKVAAANITPDPSGISYYDEATFIKTMRTGQIGARQLNPIMPWIFYRNMTDEDLRAVWAYIHALKPILHNVDNSLAPTICRKCGYSHGLGETNKK